LLASQRLPPFFLFWKNALQSIEEAVKEAVVAKADISGTVLTFALGLGIGAVAALLLARKSGEDLRGDIADAVNDGAHRVRATAKQVRRRAQEIVDMAAEQVQDAVDAGSNAYNDARKA
jgi:gas vesicle protein